MRIPARFAVLGAWLRHRTAPRAWHVPASEMLRFLLQPSPLARGSRFVADWTDGPDVCELRVNGLARPLLVPAEIPRFILHAMLHEQLTSWDWHLYQVPGMEVGPSDIVVDCGACEGLFVLLNLHAARVIAVEPLARMCDALRKNFTDCRNVTIVQAALGPRDGRVSIEGSGIDAVPSLDDDGETPMLRLDTIVARENLAPTYIKADLEGWEMDMLAGARETIFQHRPRIAITTYHKRDHWREIRDFLHAIHPGYHITFRGLVASGAPMMCHARP